MRIVRGDRGCRHLTRKETQHTRMAAYVCQCHADSDGEATERTVQGPTSDSQRGIDITLT